MSTTSSDLKGGPGPKIHLLDLPKELKDQIYGYVVCGIYLILPHSQRGLPALRGDDFRHLSILRVSKYINCEVMKVLQMKSWFIYDLSPFEYPSSLFQETPSLFQAAPTQHMMNVELMVGHYSTFHDMRRIMLEFAGRHILRRTCHILIPRLKFVLVGGRRTSKYELLRLYFQYIMLLTGFETVVVQVDLSLERPRREVGYDDERAKMLRDMIEFSEPALGPAVPCDSLREGYDVNFKFSPRRFVAEQLASIELGVGNEEHKRDQ